MSLSSRLPSDGCGPRSWENSAIRDRTGVGARPTVSPWGALRLTDDVGVDGSRLGSVTEFRDSRSQQQLLVEGSQLGGGQKIRLGRIFVVGGYL
jgi:hypothetical protein